MILASASVDCERLGGGLLAQPVNSLSSLAFVVAGIWILVRAQRRVVRRDAIAVGLAAAAVGVGSVAFHGVAGAPAQWLHDTSLLVLVGLVAFKHVAPRQLSVGGAAPITGVVAGSWVLASPNSTTPVAVVLVLCVAASEVVATRRHGARLIPWSLAAMLAFGLSASWLGRTGSVLCRPGSVLQLHAVWHVVMAVATAWWAECAILGAPTTRGVETAGGAGSVAVPAQR